MHVDRSALLKRKVHVTSIDNGTVTATVDLADISPIAARLATSVRVNGHMLSVAGIRLPIRSDLIPCDPTAAVDGIEQTLTAGGSSLSFDAGSNQYTYVWKTDKTWAGQCRQLVLKFPAGSVRRADFKFK